jgi:hypothetical protein
VATSLLVGCKKKDFPQGSGGLPDLLTECDCDTIPPFSGWSPSGTYPTISDSTRYLSPKFNPNNDNEIIFFDSDVYGNNGGIYKFNLQTNLKTAIYTGVPISSNITWSSKDWIIFQKNTNFNLYKIKSNGDSLTQLTFQSEFFHPNWNFDGTKFIAYLKNTNKTMVLNEYGTVVDTIENWLGGGDWQHPLYVLTRLLNSTVVVMNIESKNIFKEINLESPNALSTLGWATDDKIIYGDTTGMFTYWINNGIKQKMRNFCNASYYASMTRNSSSTKLAFCKVEQKLIDINGEEYLLVDSKLVIMNTDGSNEQEIIIP